MSRGWNIDDTRAMREVLLDRIGRFPRPAVELFTAVRDDFGEVGLRRMWRALERLLKSGEVVRVGRKWQPEGYVRAAQQRRAA